MGYTTQLGSWHVVQAPLSGPAAPAALSPLSLGTMLCCLQVESIKASTLHRQQQLDSEAAQLQQQQAKLTQQLLEFQARVGHAEASLQDREAALGDLQVMHGAT